MMNNEATHVKTQEDYSKFSSIVNEFLQEQMNEDFMEKNLLEAGVTSLQMMRISNGHAAQYGTSATKCSFCTTMRSSRRSSSAK